VDVALLNRLEHEILVELGCHVWPSFTTTAFMRGAAGRSSRRRCRTCS
jgi:hypothetical protein